jgi:hypothetical protein
VGLGQSRVGQRLARGFGSFKRGRDSPEGAFGPRTRRRLALGGVRSSSEAETFVARHLAHERGGDLPEGYHDRPFGGPLWLFGSWALLCFGSRPRGVCFVVCGFVCLPFIIFRNGCFPPLLGTPMAILGSIRTKNIL